MSEHSEYYPWYLNPNTGISKEKKDTDKKGK